MWKRSLVSFRTKHYADAGGMILVGLKLEKYAAQHQRVMNHGSAMNP